MRKQLEEGAALWRRAADELVLPIEEAAQMLVAALSGGGKVLAFGNGGSAADAQHFAAELVGRFRRERPAFAAIALNTNASVISAVANDYSFDEVFARQVEALTMPGDVIVAVSTSGNSENVIRGAAAAVPRGAKVIALTGEGGGRLKDHAHVSIIVPSSDTPRVQELHIGILHILCDLTETALA